MRLAALSCLLLSSCAPVPRARDTIEQEDNVVREAVGMPAGLPSLLLNVPELGKKAETDKAPAGQQSPGMPGMFTCLERCMIESRIGKRFNIAQPRSMPDDAAVFVYELAAAKPDITFSTTKITRFLAYVERSQSVNAVVSLIHLTKATDKDSDADAWRLGLEVTQFANGSRATRSSALAMWARLARAVGESPNVRAGVNLTKLRIAGEQDHLSIRASGTVANLEIHAELVDVVSSLSAFADVTPGPVQAGDSSWTFTALEARLEND
jgi:hypothetical protein